MALSLSKRARSPTPAGYEDDTSKRKIVDLVLLSRYLARPKFHFTQEEILINVENTVAPDFSVTFQIRDLIPSGMPVNIANIEHTQMELLLEEHASFDSLREELRVVNYLPNMTYNGHRVTPLNPLANIVASFYSKGIQPVLLEILSKPVDSYIELSGEFAKVPCRRKTTPRARLPPASGPVFQLPFQQHTPENPSPGEEARPMPSVPVIPYLTPTPAISTPALGSGPSVEEANTEEDDGIVQDGGTPKDTEVNATPAKPVASSSTSGKDTELDRARADQARQVLVNNATVDDVAETVLLDLPAVSSKEYKSKGDEADDDEDDDDEEDNGEEAGGSADEEELSNAMKNVFANAKAPAHIDDPEWKQMIQVFMLQKPSPTMRIALRFLKKKLMLHQALWLIHYFDHRRFFMNRFLADEMGVGKTCEIYAVFAANLEVYDMDNDINEARLSGNGRHVDAGQCGPCPSQGEWSFMCKCAADSLTRHWTYKLGPTILISPNMSVVASWLSQAKTWIVAGNIDVRSAWGDIKTVNKIGVRAVWDDLDFRQRIRQTTDDVGAPPDPRKLLQAFVVTTPGSMKRHLFDAVGYLKWVNERTEYHEVWYDTNPPAFVDKYKKLYPSLHIDAKTKSREDWIEVCVKPALVVIDEWHLNKGPGLVDNMLEQFMWDDVDEMPYFIAVSGTPWEVGPSDLEPLMRIFRRQWAALQQRHITDGTTDSYVEEAQTKCSVANFKIITSGMKVKKANFNPKEGLRMTRAFARRFATIGIQRMKTTRLPLPGGPVLIPMVPLTVIRRGIKSTAAQAALLESAFKGCHAQHRADFNRRTQRYLRDLQRFNDGEIDDEPTKPVKEKSFKALMKSMYVARLYQSWPGMAVLSNDLYPQKPTVEHLVASKLTDWANGNLRAILPSLLYNATKLDALRLILEEMIKEKKDEPRYQPKLVIMVHYQATLDILEGFFETQYPNDFKTFKRSSVCGQKDFDEMLQVFNDESQYSKVNVIIATGRSVGVGKSMQGASRLILFEPDAHRGLTLQNLSRSHRIDSTRPCVVYRFWLVDSRLERAIMVEAEQKTIMHEVHGESVFVQAQAADAGKANVF